MEALPGPTQPLAVMAGNEMIPAGSFTVHLQGTGSVHLQPAGSTAAAVQPPRQLTGINMRSVLSASAKLSRSHKRMALPGPSGIDLPSTSTDTQVAKRCPDPHSVSNTHYLLISTSSFVINW